MAGPAVVLSLDFELRWGLFDILGDDQTRYRKNLEGVREAVPLLLEMFAARRVRATWAIVGAIACSGWDEWAERAPPPPRYDDAKLRWREEYRRADPTGSLYFAPDLVELVRETPGQELGSHTFSHVYAAERGFTRADAVADATAMETLFRQRWGATAVSHVFPRNQIGFVDVLRAHGVRAWRDNPAVFYWSRNTTATESKLIRALRLADSLAPLGRRAAPASAQRASHFVRVNLPERLWRLHRARIAREARALRDNEALHLWWHPHNLGASPRRSVARIAELLDAVGENGRGRHRYATMGELAGAA